MAVCPSCGASVPEGNRFCSECGAKLEASAPAPIDPPAPESAPVLPELPVMDIPVPAVPAVEEAVSAPAEAPAQEPEERPAEAPAQSEAASVYAAPVYTAPAYEAPKPQPAPAAAPRIDADRPGKKSKYAPMTSWGIALQIVLMQIPVIGFFLTVIWACGGCRKIVRRNLARANLILMIIAIVLLIVAALLVRFLFADVITEAFETILPGYTLQWS